MAKRKTNKAEKIREAFGTLGAEARPKDVIAHLAAKKIKVPASQVSSIRSKLGGAPAKKGGRGRKPASGNLIALSDLQAAKKLIEQLGSIEKAQTALSALAKLQ
jgi:hypothetical protein